MKLATKFLVAPVLCAALISALGLAASSGLLSGDAAWAGVAVVLVLDVALSASMARSVIRPVARASALARSVAAGDLTATVEVDASGELRELQHALLKMQASLRRVAGEVRRAAQSIAAASGQIASGNSDLSERTDAQASSLDETSASIMNLTQTVQGNGESAAQADALAASASQVARRGGVIVGEVVERMDAITGSSRKIAEIVGVIDGIAFQTNILALNAAVEAARAGEQGRGFAVVAGEVRALAQRSAEAAREIKGLITASVAEVESGSALVRQAGATMAEIVTSVKRVADIIGEIGAATAEQNRQIEQVSMAVRQLDRMTQQNAALVEQSAASAESLKDQARALDATVAAFHVEARPAVSRQADPDGAARPALLPRGSRAGGVDAGRTGATTALAANARDDDWETF